MKPDKETNEGRRGWIRDWIEAIWKSLRPPKRKRLELRYLSYADADKLIRETNGAWTIAPEEDNNRRMGWVYLERLEEIQLKIIPGLDRAYNEGWRASDQAYPRETNPYPKGTAEHEWWDAGWSRSLDELCGT